MSNGKLLYGQLMFGAHQLPIQFTEEMMDSTSARALLGQAHTEITPNDQDSSKVKVYTTPDLSDYWLSYDGIERRMRIPDILTDLELTFETNGAASSYTDSGTNLGTGTYHLGQSASGQCQASAAVIPKLIHSIREIWSFNPHVTHYFYFGTAFDQATILAKLAGKLGVSVNPWPVFKPESLVFKGVSQRNNASARVAVQGTAGSTSSSQTQGHGDGYDHNSLVQDIQLPATLHGSFTLSPSTSTLSKDAVGSASFTGTMNAAAGATAHAVAVGSLTPSSVSATSPAGIPSSGLYLFDFDIEPAEEFGWFFAHAVVFDFAILA